LNPDAVTKRGFKMPHRPAKHLILLGFLFFSCQKFISIY